MNELAIELEGMDQRNLRAASQTLGSAHKAIGSAYSLEPLERLLQNALDDLLFDTVDVAIP